MEAHEAGHAARLAAADPRRARGPELGRVRALLAAAFAEDPVMNWSFKAGPGKAKAFDAFFDFALTQQCARHDEVHVAGDFSAAAVWLPPGGVRDLNLPWWRMLLMLPRLAAMTGWSRMGRGMAMGEAMEKHHPKTPPHWYLYFVGVDPAMQGKGLGSAILEATLRRVDADGMPAHLDNSNPKNTRLYERHGFKVVSEFRARPDAPPIWGMWRGGRS